MEEQRKNRLPKQYKRVMIVRFTALSDVAMTVPVVYSVCDDNRQHHDGESGGQF